MEEVTIRPARPEELSTVAELRWQWEQERTHETPPVPRDEFVPWFTAWARENDSHRCTVVVRDGVVIGMAWLTIVPRPPWPRELERWSGDVQCVYVVPEERDCGIGGRLIDAVLAIARELGVRRVIVHSSERAISAYTRCGFAASERLLLTDLSTP